MNFTITRRGYALRSIDMDALPDFTYNGAAQEPTPDVWDGGVLLSKDADHPDYELTYTNNLNAGTAMLTVTGINNYIGEQNRNFVIDRMDITVTPDAGQNKMLGTDDPVLTYTATPVVAGETAVFPGALTRDIGEDIGDYAITIGTLVLADGIAPNAFLAANYNLLFDETPVTFAITPVDASTFIIADIAPFAYDGTAHMPEPAMTKADGITALTAGTDYTLSYAANTNAGTATLTVTGIGNYVGTQDKTFAITPVALTVTPDAGQSKTYGDAELALTFTSAGAVGTETPAFTGALGRDAGEDVGTYAINAGTLALAENDPFLATNYTLTFNADPVVNFAITPKDAAELTIVDIATLTYNGAAQTPAPVVKDGENVLAQGDDYMLSYANNTNAGTATVTVTGTGNYTGTQNKAYTIAPIAITVTPTASQFKTYGQDDPALTYSYSAASSVAGETPAFNVDGVLARVAGDNVGTYAITQGTLALADSGAFLADNYALSFTANVPFTIIAKNVDANFTIAAVAPLTYNGLAQTPTPSVNDGDTLLLSGTDYTLSYADNTNVGEATLTATFKGNYSGTKQTNFNITQATLTVTPDANQAKTFGELDPVLAYMASGTVNGETPAFTGALARAAGTDIGTYAINQGTLAMADGVPFLAANYSLVFAAEPVVNFTINAKNASTFTIADIAPVDYTGVAQMPEPAVSDGGTVLTKDTDYALSYSADTINAGTATVTVTGIGNYTGTQDKDFTITPITITVTPDAGQSKTFGDADPAEFADTRTSTTVVDGETPAYTGALVRTAGENAGTYAINQGDLLLADGVAPNTFLAANYSLDFTAGVDFTINAKDATTLTIADIAPLAYTGIAQTPEPEVKDGATVLTKGTDYTLSYANNTNAGVDTATVTVTGTGNYTGTQDKFFTISQVAITVTPDANQSKVFGAADPAVLTYTATDGVNGETPAFTGALARAAGEVVGTYAIEQNTLALAGNGTFLASNYSLAFTTGVTFAIATYDASTLTIAPIDPVTYTGADQTPTPEVKNGETVLTENTDYILSYTDNINAGTATLTLTGIGDYSGTQDKAFTISPITITVTPDAGQGKIYGEADPAELTYTATQAAVVAGETPVYTGALARVAGGNAGTYAIGQDTLDLADGVAPNNFLAANYSLSFSAGVDFTINAKNASTLTVADIAPLAYTGAAQMPAPEVKDGDTVLTKDIDYTLSYSADTTNAGTATLTVTGIGNYTGTQDKTFTITPLTITVTPDAGQNKTFGDADPAEFTDTRTPTEVIPGETPAYTGALARVVGENAGTYAINQGNLLLADGEAPNNFRAANYSLVFTDGVDFTINPKNVDVNFTVAAVGPFIYNGTAWTPTPAVKDGDTDLTKDTDYTLSYTDNTNAGTATLTVTFTGNYSGTLAPIFTINKATITVTPLAGQSKIFGEANPVLAYTAVGAAAGETPTFTGALAPAPGDDVGEYAIVQDSLLLANGTAPNPFLVTNYNLVFTPGVTFAITPKNASTFRVADILPQVYNGAAYTPEPEVKDGATVLIKDTDYTLSYSADTTNAGTATLTVTGINNYVGTQDKDFTITPVALTVTPDAGQSKTYGEAEPTLTFTSAGAIGTETPAFSGELARVDAGTATGENAGTYAITLGSLALADNGSFLAANYSLALSPVPVTFAITPKDASGFPIPAIGPYTYDGQRHRPTPEIKDGDIPLIKDTDYTLVYNRNLHASVDTAKVTVTYKGNYSGSAIKFFNILPAPLTLTPDAEQTKTFGDSDPAFSYAAPDAIVGAITGETPAFTGALARVAGEDVGTYAITQGTLALADNDPFIASNYDLTVSAEVLFEITKKDLSAFPVAAAGPFIYDGSEHTPEPQVSNGATVLIKDTDYTLAYTNNTNVGTATLTITGIGNYEGTQDKTFTINRATIVVTPNDGQDKTFGEADPEFAYVAPGVVAGQEPIITGALTRIGAGTVAGENAGTYAITQGTLALADNGPFLAANYKLVLTEGKTFTINPKPAGDFAVPVNASYTYTGLPQEPTPEIKDGDITLIEVTDYTLGYSADHTNVGTVTLTVTYRGNYSGTKAVTFAITSAPLTVTPLAGQTKVFGSDDPVFAFSSTGAVNGETPAFTGALNRVHNDTSENIGDRYAILIGDLELVDNAPFLATNYNLFFNATPVTFTITRKNASTFTIADIASRTYDGTAYAPTPDVYDGENLLVIGADKDYTLSYAANTNAGTATLTVTGRGNYTGTKNKDYTIAPITITVTPTPDQYKTLGELDPILTYTYAADAVIAGQTPKFTGALSRDAGETVRDDYAITLGTLALTDGDGDNAFLAANYSLAIDAETFEITIFDQDLSTPFALDINSSAVVDGPFIYNGTEHTPKPAVTYDGLLLKDSDYTLTYANNTNAGTATLTVTGIENGDYEGLMITTYFTITPATLTATPDANQTKTFGEPDPVLDYTASGAVNGETPAFTGALERAAGTDIGEYAINQGTLAMADNAPFQAANYSLVFAAEPVVNFTINAKDAGIFTIADIAPADYNGAAHMPTPEVKDGETVLAKGTDYELSYTNNTNAGVDTATVIVIGKEGSNYTGAKAKTFTINAKDASTLTIADIASRAYTGLAQMPAPEVKDGGTVLVKGTHYTLSYADNTNAGIATVTVTGIGDYTGSVNTTFAINPATLTVTPNAGQLKVKGSTDPVLTYAATGAVNDETPAFTGALTRSAGEDAGAYAISQGTLALANDGAFKASNYTLAFTPGATFEIKTPSNFTIGDVVLVYTGTTHAPTPEVRSGETLLTKDTDYSLSIVSGVNAGEDVRVTVVGMGDYLGAQEKVFTIEPANLTITPVANQSKVYGAVDPVLTYTSTGAIVGEAPAFTGALGREEGENAAPYAFTLGTLAPADGDGENAFLATNYTLALNEEAPTFAITPATITVTPVAGQSKVYGADDPVLTFTATGAIAGQTSAFTGALGRTEGEDVGSYAFTLGTLELADGAGDNAAFKAANYSLALATYEAPEEAPTFAITPTVITVTPVAGQSKVYGADDPVLTYTTSEAVNGETPAFTGALGRTEGEDVGSYAFTLGTLELADGAGDNAAFLAANYTLALATYEAPEEAPTFAIRYNASTLTIAPIGPVTYDGTAYALTPEVKNGNTVLTKGTDYELSYAANTNAGTATLTLIGIGDYSGTQDKTFTIVPATITVTPDDGQDKAFGAPDPVLTYEDEDAVVGAIDGETPAFTGALSRVQGENVRDGGYPITQGTLALKDNGTFKAANYTLAFAADPVVFTIEPEDISDSTTVADINDVIYTGLAQEPTPVVTNTTTGLALVKDTDYTLSYKNNTNVGTATVTVTFKGNYTGSKETTFAITAKDASTLTIDDIAPLTYNGEAQEPAVTVKDGATTLAMGEDEDYTVSYTNNTNAGTATVTVTGQGNYTGTKDKSFTIAPIALTVTANAGQTKVFGAADPETIEYTVTPAAVVAGETPDFDGALVRAAGEAVGTYAISQGTLVLVDNDPFKAANYSLAFTPGATFAITAKNANTLTIADIAERAYTGLAHMPAPEVKDGGTVLVKDRDYTLSYNANTNAGKNTATVTVTGQGNYTGTQDKTFTITPVAITVTPKANQSKLVGDDDPALTYTFTGAVNGETPAFAGALTRAAGETLGTYAITNDGDDVLVLVDNDPFKASNYTLEFTPGVLFTIAAKDASHLTIAAIAERAYTGLAQTPTPEVKDGDTVLVKGTDYTLNYADNTNAGIATVTVTGSGDYSGSVNTTFAITKATITVTPNAGQLKVKGSTDPVLTYAATGAVNDETPAFTGALERAAGEDAGTYAITQGTLALTNDGAFLAANYTLAFTADKTFEIKTPSDFTIGDVVLVYTGAPHAPTPEVKDGDKVLEIGNDYSLSIVSGVNAGEDVRVTVVGMGDYLGAQEKVFTIEPANLTITPVANQSKVYGAVDPVLTYTSTGAIVGEPPAFTGALSRAEGEAVGTYAFTLGTLAPADGAEGNPFLAANYTLALATYEAPAEAPTFGITAKSLAGDTFTIAAIASRAYSGLAQKPTPVVKDGATTLIKDTDYTLTYADNTNVGTATVTVTGKGNYTGKTDKTFTITPVTITVTADAGQSKTIGDADPTLTYAATGAVNGQTPAFTGAFARAIGETVGTYAIGRGDLALANGEGENAAFLAANYTLAFTSGATFAITAKSLAGEAFTIADIAPLTYTGVAQKPEPDVKDGDDTLVLGTDYTLTYANNTNAGTATVTVKGKGNYTGTKDKTFTIGKATLTVAPNANQSKVFGAADPALTYQQPIAQNGETPKFAGKLARAAAGTDSGEAVGTYAITLGTLALGDNGAFKAANYTLALATYEEPAVAPTFAITAKPASTLTIDDIAPLTYNGEAQEATLTVKDGERTLEMGEDKDYTVSYAANTNAGTATVTVTGQGNYTGTKDKTFTIVPATITVTPNAGQTKVFGADDPATIEYTVTPAAVVAGETPDFDGALVRAAGEAVGTYAITQGTLVLKDNGDFKAANYSLAFTPDKTFEITAKNITGETFTIADIASRAYTGLAHMPAPEVKDGDTVLVKDRDYTLSYAANTNAGENTATVTVTGKGNYTDTKDQTFTITSVAITVTPKANQSKLFGADDPILTYTFTGAVNGETPAFAGALTRAAGETLGTYAISQGSLALADSDPFKASNYTLAFTPGVVFTIAAKDASHLTIADIAARTYDGLAQTPTPEVKDGDTVLVKGTHYTLSYADNTNAGIATVTVTGIGDYTGSVNTTFAINPATLTVTPNAGQLKVKGSTDPVLTYTTAGAVNDETPAFTGALTRAAGEDAGTYAITQGTLALTNDGAFLSANYTLAFTAGVNFEIKTPSDFTIGAVVLVYTGAPHAPTPDVWSGETLLTKDTHYSLSIVSGVNAGEEVRVTVVGMGDYSGAQEKVFTIEPANLTITPVANQSKVFGAVDPVLTYTSTGAIVGETPAFTGALSRAEGEAVGTYAFTLGTLAPADGAEGNPFLAANYTLTLADEAPTFAITAKSLAGDSFTIGAIASRAYTGLEQKPTPVVKDGVTTLVKDIDYTLTYADNTNVGTATVTVTCKGNYTGETAPTFEITPAIITITPDAKTKVFGADDPALTYTATGAVNGETPAFAGELTREEGETVGTYAITQGTLALANGADGNAFKAANYTLAFTPGATFAITAKPIAEAFTIADIAPDNTLPYTGKAQTPTPEVKDGDTVLVKGTDYTLSYANNTTLGTATGPTPPTVIVTGKGNYTGTKEKTFAIIPATITVTPTAGQSKAFGAADPALAFTATAAQNGETPKFAGELARAEGEDIGDDYAITIGTLALADNGAFLAANYTLALATYEEPAVAPTFAITPATITVTPVAGQSKVYGADDPVLTFTATGAIAGQTPVFTGALTRAEGEAVGTYAFTLETLALANGEGENTFKAANYSLALAEYVAPAVAPTFAITPAVITVTPTANLSKVFGAADPELTYAFSDAVNDETPVITGTLGRANGEAAGTYAFTLGTLAPKDNDAFLAANYSLALAEYVAPAVAPTFAITPAVITVTPSDDQSKAYGSDDPILAYTATGAIAGETPAFTGALARAEGEAVGTYAITQGTLALANGEGDNTFKAANYSLALATYDAPAVAPTFAITPAVITVTPDAGQFKVADVADPVLTYTFSDAANGETPVITGALGRAAGEDIGTYAFTLGTLVLAAGDAFLADNYILALAPGVTFEIKEANDFTIGDVGMVYTGATHAPTPDVWSGETLLAKDTHYSLSIVSGVNAGEDVRVTVVGMGDYHGVQEKVFTIVPAVITITPDAKTKVYGAADPELTYADVTAVVEGETPVITGALSREEGENAGNYAFILDDLFLADGDGDNAFLAANYTLALATYEAPAEAPTFGITPATITITPNAGQSKVYGAADPELAYAFSDAVNDETPAFTGALGRADGEAVGTYAFTLGTLAPADGEEGNPFLAANYTLALAEYDAPAVAPTFAITPATITVTPTANQSKVYGAADPVLTYAFSDAVNGEIPAFTGALARAEGENAGTYAITQGTLVLTNGEGDNAFLAANYTLALAEPAEAPTFTITPMTITVAPTANQSKVFGAADPALTFTNTGALTGQTPAFTGALTRAAGETLGTYAISQGSLALANSGAFLAANYTLEFTPGVVFTIAAKDASHLTIAAIAERAYTGVAQEPTPEVKDGDTVLDKGTHYTLSYADNTNAGIATVTVTGKGNYTGTQDKSFAITPVTITVTPNAGQTKVFGAADPVLTYAFSDAANGQTPAFVGALTRVKGEMLGAYDITIGTLALADGEDDNAFLAANYAIGFTRGVKMLIVTSNFDQDKSGTFALSSTALQLTISEVDDVIYAPETAWTPEPEVKWNDMVLIKDHDYLLHYQDNVNAGTAHVIVTGLCNVDYSKSFAIGQATATITIDDASFAYDGIPKEPAVTTTPAGLSVAILYNGAADKPIAVGTYTVAASINEPNYQGVAVPVQIEITKGTATISFADTSVGYDGTAKVPTVTTEPADLAVVLSYQDASGEQVDAPIAAGTYAVTATIDDANYQGEAETELVINKAPATISFENLEVTYDGTAKAPTVTTEPADLAVVLSYQDASGEQVGAPIAAGTYAVTASIDDTNYQGEAETELVINKATATISFAGTNVTYNGTAKAPTTTTEPAGLKVDMLYNGAADMPINAGTYAVTASIDDTNYQGEAETVLVINKATATISFADLEVTYDGTAKAPTVTTVPAGRKVDMLYNGAASEPINAGTYAVTASIDDTNYQGAGTADFEIKKAKPTITWPTPLSINEGTALSATQLAATANIPGTFVYEPPRGTILPLGTHTLQTTFVPKNLANWESPITTSVELSVITDVAAMWLAVTPHNTLDHITLVFGEAENATNDLDVNDALAPEAQVAKLVCSHITDPDKRYLGRDFRPIPTPNGESRWRLEISTPNASQIFALTWDVTAAEPTRKIYLQRLVNEQAVGFPVNMRDVSAFDVVGNGVFEIAYAPAAETTLSLRRGWNFVGNSIMSEQSLADILSKSNTRADDIFGEIWLWRNGRNQLVTLDQALNPECGYWIYCQEAFETAPIFGVEADGVIMLQPGWNLLSPPYDCTMPSADGIIPMAWQVGGDAFHMADANSALKAGKGYWLFVDAAAPITVKLARETQAQP
ncbi:MBG domain-containing protein [Oligosphaera ethanolica]|uniref:Uncharacterized protein n=1 Tax=Oligosphaera ethanolica TaxID=760260 RepID=A0AAE3VF16_9BACT|nr:MBG domain-containing protein [Oligosphaera ethanolica]MDQ0289312.1 hypothetical protein [Oligosphaera ethanolica]